jgi:hypothetical protein
VQGESPGEVPAGGAGAGSSAPAAPPAPEPEPFSGPTPPPSPGDLMAAASQGVRSRPLLTSGLAEGVHHRAAGGLSGAMAAVAGGLVALGITVVALGDDPSPWIVAAVGALLVVLAVAVGLSVRAWVAATGWPVGPLASVGTVLALGGAGVLVVGIVGVVSEDSTSSSIFWWPYLLLAGVLLALWLLPGVQGRPAVLGAGLLALVFAVSACVAVQEVEDGLTSSSSTAEESFTEVGRAIDDGYSFGYQDGYADGYVDGELDSEDDEPYGDGYDGVVSGEDGYALGYELGYPTGYDDGFYGDEYDVGTFEDYDDEDDSSITAFSGVGPSPFGVFGVAGDAWSTAAWVALLLGVVLVLASAVSDHVGWRGTSTPMVFAGLVAAVNGGVGVVFDAGVAEYVVLGLAALLVLGVGALAGRRATTWIAAGLLAALVIATLDEALDPGAGDTVVIGVAVLVAGVAAAGVAVALALWVQPSLHAYQAQRGEDDRSPVRLPTG